MQDEEQHIIFGRLVEINERLGRLDTALSHVEDKLRCLDAEIHKLHQWRNELQDKVAVVLSISARIDEMCSDMRAIRSEVHGVAVRLARIEAEKEASLRGHAELEKTTQSIAEWIRWVVPGGWIIVIMAGLGALGIWMVERLR